MDKRWTDKVPVRVWTDKILMDKEAKDICDNYGFCFPGRVEQPIRYLTKLRLERAMKLIHSAELKLEETSVSCGLYMKVSPGKLRRQMKAQGYVSGRYEKERFSFYGCLCRDAGWPEG